MPLIILDRDGVLNQESENYVKSPAEWIAIPKSLEAVAQLNRAGYIVVIATNQSGLARGYYDLATLDEIHEKMAQELAAVGGYIDQIFFCPHQHEDHCVCRKPNPGLLYQIQKKYHVDLADVFFVGDSLRDVQAAQAAGCKPILLLTGNGQAELDNHPELNNILHFKNLTEAVSFILSN